jgi:hypothetical protein
LEDKMDWWSVKNGPTLLVLKTLADHIPTTYKQLDPIVFSAPEQTLFYETIQDPARRKEIALVAKGLGLAPYLTGDSSTDFPSDWADEFIEGKRYPAHTQTPTDSALDCFLSNAEAFCTKGPDGSYTCDLQAMKVYEVKSDHLNYGGEIVLDSDKHVVSVSGETPGSPHFDKELNRFLASFGVHVIVDLHATVVHLAISQKAAIYFADKSKYGDIYAKHPAVKTLVEVLTTRVNDVSENEVLLIGDNYSLVMRASSFTNDSLLDFCTQGYNTYGQLSPADLLSTLFPTDGVVKDAAVSVYDAAQALATNLCIGSNMSSGDVERLGLMLWNASFYHYLVGDYQIMNLIAGRLPLICTGKPHVQDQKYASLAATIAATTMTRALDVAEVVDTVSGEQGKDHWVTYLTAISLVGEILPGFNLSPSYPAVNF